MTEKRFHWDWQTGRMKDTYSNCQATKNMRIIERQINDACRNYEKEIANLKNENEQLQQELFESEEECLMIDYYDNPIRRDAKIELLKEHFKERFGRDFE